jgi:CRP/FNR family transcriptional regulator, cyclic AMP receptor protein
MNTTIAADLPAELRDVAEHPFLRGLKPAHLQALANCAMRLHFKPGDRILREGDPANRFYLLISGVVSLEAQRAERRITLQPLSGGDVLGWSWLFPPYYTHFDARAVEPTEAMFFYGTRLREMCEADHDLGYEILTRIAHVVTARLAALESRVLNGIHDSP